MSTERHINVFVLIDALGWSLLQGREFLSDVLTYRRPVRTVLGFSSGAIPTMLTGLPPSVTGRWNLFYYDPQGSPFRWLRPFLAMPDQLLDNRVTRKLLKEIGQHALRLGPLFECCVSPRLLPLFNYSEKRSIYGPGGIEGACSFFDVLDRQSIPFRVYTYRQFKDAEILAQARRDMKEDGSQVFFLYLSELDHLLHQNPDKNGPVGKQLDWYESELREVFRIAREADPQASFSVYSDHGMAPVQKRYDVVQAVEALGYVMPDDYLSVYDSTMARFWFFSDAARQGIVKRLEPLQCGRILRDDELETLGVLFPDRRYGEIIFLMNPGWLMARSDFHGKGWSPRGMHGYHPDDPDSDAIFLTNRPPKAEVRNLADVFAHMVEAIA
jgi:predicted AlkP superfamily pyrophosphatase or phosphodiesterase